MRKGTQSGEVRYDATTGQTFRFKGNGHPWVDWRRIVPDLGTSPKEVTYRYCIHCGETSIYRVGRQGFCMSHRREAYEAQAVYWESKLTRFAFGVERYL